VDALMRCLQEHHPASFKTARS